MERAGLVIFGSLFAVLFSGVALAIGIGAAPPVPTGDVAIVEGAPGRLEEITKAEFAHEMRVQALEGGLKGVPGPAGPEYGTLKREAMTKLIEVDWVEAQAIEMGLTPTPREIVEKLSPGEGEAMEEIGLTQKDVDARMRWYLSGDKIQEMLRERVADPTSAEIRSYYEEERPPGKSLAEAREEIIATLRGQKEKELFGRVENGYRREWRVRTRCAEGFMVEDCSNFPSFGHPVTAPQACYEADPREPAEECPAPVNSPAPSRPGSVTWWRPEGERFAQRPVPIPNEEAEAPAE